MLSGERRFSNVTNLRVGGAGAALTPPRSPALIPAGKVLRAANSSDNYKKQEALKTLAGGSEETEMKAEI